jgi:hypothetical protein
MHYLPYGVSVENLPSYTEAPRPGEQTDNQLYSRGMSIKEVEYR